MLGHECDQLIRQTRIGDPIAERKRAQNDEEDHRCHFHGVGKYSGNFLHGVSLVKNQGDHNRAESRHPGRFRDGDNTAIDTAKNNDRK